MAHKVETKHPKYGGQAAKRKIFRDVINGALALRKGKQDYLPQFPAEENDTYDLRVNAATLYNMTAKTVEVMTGMVFANDITLDDNVPNEIKGTDETPGLVKNFDNCGTEFNRFASHVFEKSFEGTALLLVDAGTVSADSRADERIRNLRPYCVLYEADAVINWHFEFNEETQTRELALLVLSEPKTVLNGFEIETVKRYRVFRKEAGLVTWQLYEDVTDTQGKKTELALINEGPLMLPHIPAVFVGEPDADPPLMDLTLKNIEHYQTYSDYKSLIHKTNVPMFWTVNHIGDKPEVIGGDIWWELGENGAAGWAEVEGGALGSTRQALEDIKIEMAQLGLSMLAAQPNSDITATEALLNSVQETSGLQTMALSLKNALEICLGYMAEYLGQPMTDGGSIELGAKWAELIMSNEQLSEFSQMVSDGHLSIDSFLWMLEKGGQLPPNITAEKEKERLGAANDIDGALQQNGILGLLRTSEVT